MISRLQAEKLEKSFGRRKVLNRVSLAIRAGEVVGLLGPNGAGKTTTFGILAGLIAADKGRVYLDDEDITNWPMYLRAQAGIGLLPQEPSVFLGLTVEENLRAIQEMVSKESRSRTDINELLQEFGLKELRRTKAVLLSGGERRKLELARSMVVRPDFLLLDEPFTGIDPLATLEIQSLLLGLKNQGLGILITDHNVRETLKITDRAAIIDRGEVLETGTPDEIVSSPEVRKRYLGEDFRLS
ncbi:MAG: LPS export ABC transporter ATP-binding protein [Candidatus Aminicenantales bacterium]